MAWVRGLGRLGDVEGIKKVALAKAQANA